MFDGVADQLAFDNEPTFDETCHCTGSSRIDI
jgi:hypothetical protein